MPRAEMKCLPLLSALALVAACGRGTATQESHPEPTAKVVYVVVTPTAAPLDSSAALAAALTALPQPTPTLAVMAAKQPLATPTAAPTVAPAMIAAAPERLQPTPPTVLEELQRCVTYSAVDDEIHRAEMLPGNVPLLITARNSCDMPFPADDSWFEVRAVDHAGHVLARATGQFITALPAKGTAESAIILSSIDDSLRLQVTYQVKPWWAAGGGRRLGE